MMPNSIDRYEYGTGFYIPDGTWRAVRKKNGESYISVRAFSTKEEAEAAALEAHRQHIAHIERDPNHVLLRDEDA